MADDASLKSKELRNLMDRIGQAAREAAVVLSTADEKQKSAAIVAAAECLQDSTGSVLAGNEIDLANGKEKKLSAAMLDRLRLDESRLQGVVDALQSIARLPDPVGRVLSQWDRPNGLQIQRVSTPLGVVGVIYESRPNVTADAAALCLKAGNSVILRGGSDSFHSSSAIAQAVGQGIAAVGLPATCVQLVPSVHRDAVGMMLQGLNGNVDVVVPRGGKGLVQRVESESRVPVFAHLEGICHVYIHERADLQMAIEVVVNSKMRRTGICGAVETLLIDQKWPPENSIAVLEALVSAGCEIRGDQSVCSMFPAAVAANQSDWITEYLAATLSVKTVSGVAAAIDHINRYGSHHTESIITGCDESAEQFLRGIDSAILLHNASTQFADGGEFGMGAEIGIATGKMHARGPVGAAQLTSFNYRVRGTGQVRR